MAVRPAKTQISLGIHPVWSESLLSAWRKLDTLATLCVHSENYDQTGQMPRLIWIYDGRTLILLVLSCRGPFKRNTMSLETENKKNSMLPRVGNQKTRKIVCAIQQRFRPTCAQQRPSQMEQMHSLIIIRQFTSLLCPSSNESCHQKICLWGFGPVKTQTSLLSYRD